jgi:hypothetical protein
VAKFANCAALGLPPFSWELRGPHGEEGRMSSDLIGRRRAVQERLERARDLELSVQENTALLTEASGMRIEDLDFDGSLRAALSSMTSLASRRTHFDVIVTIPDAPFAVRIRNLNNAVSAEVVVHRDGPYDTTPATAPPPTYPPVPAPAAWGAAASGSAGDHVASDLAALLWEGLDDVPS